MPYLDDGKPRKRPSTPPLPTRRAAMGYREPDMLPLELPSSIVPLSKFHPHGAAIWHQPACRLLSSSLREPHLPSSGNNHVEASSAVPICGVGLSLTNRRKDPWENVRVHILAIKPSSPSGFCGRLAIDDEVLAVDEQNAAGMDAAQLSRLIRGPEGTVVRLTMRKCTDQTDFEVCLMRAQILENSFSDEEMNTAVMPIDNQDGSIGVTVVNGKIPGTWQAKLVKPGGGAWLGSPDWSSEGQIVDQACLLDGDIIWSVDNTPVRNIQKPQSALRGIPFTRVSLQIQREPNATRWYVDIVRSKLLHESELNACILYRTKLGENLKLCMAQSLKSNLHNAQHLQAECEQLCFEDAGGHLFASSGKDVSSSLLPWNISSSSDIPRQSEGCGKNAQDDCDNQFQWKTLVSDSTPSNRLSPGGSASPCGSVDSLDAVIQRLDKASNHADVTQSQLSHVAPAQAVDMKTSAVFTADKEAKVDTRPASLGTEKIVLDEFQSLDEQRGNEISILIESEKANRSERWLCVQRDLSWMSPRRTPGRKSRSSRRSPGSVVQSGGRRGKDGKYRLDNVEPVHLRVPDNWSPWSYAGDATFLLAVHFQSGVENTHMSYEMMQKESSDGQGLLSKSHQDQAVAILVAHSEIPPQEHPDVLHWLSPSDGASHDCDNDAAYSAGAWVSQETDKASPMRNVSADDSLTNSVSPEKWVPDVEDGDMEDTMKLSVFEFEEGDSPALFRRPTAHQLLHGYSNHHTESPETFADSSESLSEKAMMDLSPLASMVSFEHCEQGSAGKDPGLHQRYESLAPAMSAQAPREDTPGTGLELAPECEAGLRTLLDRGCTDAQVLRHYTMVDFNLSLAQVRQFREISGMTSSGTWVKGIGRVGKFGRLKSGLGSATKD